MGWKKILAGTLPFAVALVVWIFRLGPRSSTPPSVFCTEVKALFTRSRTSSAPQAALFVWFLGVVRAFVCPWNQMPELTIYRQTDLESARSSAPPSNRPPMRRLTRPRRQTSPNSFHRFVSGFLAFWKKGPPSNDTTTVSGHSHRPSQGSQAAAGSTTGSTPDPAVGHPAGAGSQETPVSAEPSADATMPDSTQSYRVDHLPNGELELFFNASASKTLSYPIRVITLPPGVILGRDTADVAPAYQAPTGNGYESQVGQKTWWKTLQVAFGHLGLGN